MRRKAPISAKQPLFPGSIRRRFQSCLFSLHGGSVIWEVLGTSVPDVEKGLALSPAATRTGDHFMSCCLRIQLGLCETMLLVEGEYE